MLLDIAVDRYSMNHIHSPLSYIMTDSAMTHIIPMESAPMPLASSEALGPQQAPMIRPVRRAAGRQVNAPAYSRSVCQTGP